jgi:hypothetical protein
MPKPATVYGIVSFGGHLVRGMVRVVLTTEEPMDILECDKLYYGEDVKGRVTKTKVLTMSELTEKLEKDFATHKTDVPHMYKLNSSESVKILKTVFDVKTCKKLSFSKDSDEESEDNDSTVGAKDEEPLVKSTKGKTETAPVVKSTKGKTETAPVVKSTKGKGKTEPAPEPEPAPVVKSTKGKGKTEPAPTNAPVPKEEPVPAPSVKSTKGKSNVVETVAKKPDLSDSKKTTTSKVKESKVRIPLSDSEDDEHALDSDNDVLDS